MEKQVYHKQIVDYYRDTENAYKDSWDLDHSLAIHYGYWDQKVHSFRESLMRMNEVMMSAAGIREGDVVLDAGCGIGGSTIFLAKKGCIVEGITLSERQVEYGNKLISRLGLSDQASLKVMDYAETNFADESFDIVWGCESICYAFDKQKFIKEAYRLLKPGGRLVVADGFVTAFENNDHPFIRKWLDGWQVNYLETPQRFSASMKDCSFRNIAYRDISNETRRSAKRLYRFYFLAKLYLLWKKINFSKPPTVFQKKNIDACRYQYIAGKKGLWQYGMIVGEK